LPHAAEIGLILDDWAARTPGSFVERKSAMLAWHWRRADPERGRRQESELRLHLAEMLSNTAVEVLVGDHVVEVRPQGVHKGRVVALALEARASGTLVLAVGDDRTDDDLFRALGPEHVTVRVGSRVGASTLRMSTPVEARAFLAELASRP
jgi:trehalose 6-phosphate synthase/phosphatase